MQSFASTMRHFLDRLYFISGICAAFFLICILGLIVAQMLARWTGLIFSGAPDYAGYCMAAASFFAFAYALTHGTHIRVSVLLSHVSPTIRRYLEGWSYLIGTALAWYFVYYACRATYWSWKFHDVSGGQDATPLWIPQMSMVLGGIVFAIALTDHLCHVLISGTYRMKADIGSQSHGE